MYDITKLQDGPGLILSYSGVGAQPLPKFTSDYSKAWWFLSTIGNDKYPNSDFSTTLPAKFIKDYISSVKLVKTPYTKSMKNKWVDHFKNNLSYDPSFVFQALDVFDIMISKNYMPNTVYNPLSSSSNVFSASSDNSKINESKNKFPWLLLATASVIGVLAVL